VVIVTVCSLSIGYRISQPRFGYSETVGSYRRVRESADLIRSWAPGWVWV